MSNELPNELNRLLVKTENVKQEVAVATHELEHIKLVLEATKTATSSIQDRHAKILKGLDFAVKWAFPIGLFIDEHQAQKSR